VEGRREGGGEVEIRIGGEEEAGTIRRKTGRSREGRRRPRRGRREK
jgi:hypothetical protein